MQRKKSFILTVFVAVIIGLIIAFILIYLGTPGYYTKPDDEKRAESADEPSKENKKVDADLKAVSILMNQPESKIKNDTDGHGRGTDPSPEAVFVDESVDVVHPTKRSKSFYISDADEDWEKLLNSPLKPEYLNKYPHFDCFSSAAKDTNLPVALVLGLARCLSNFDPGSRMDGKLGIMHISPKIKQVTEANIHVDELIANPCKNIYAGCNFLAELLSKNKGRIIQALVAYRTQSTSVHPATIRDNDRIFAERVKKYVKEIVEQPYMEKRLTPWRYFHTYELGLKHLAQKEDISGVELWLGQEDATYNAMYMLYIVNEDENGAKAANLKEITGLGPMLPR